MSFNLVAQTYHYDIVKGGKVIGDMTSTKTVRGEEVVYTVRSVTNFKVIVNLKIEYELKETYLNGIYQSGSSHSELNGVSQKDSKVKKISNGYKIETESNIVTYLGDISYSIPEIYFSEPIGKKEVFSQAFGEGLIIEKEREHVYVLVSEDGRNVYTYENGICKEVKVSRSYAVFYIRLKKQNP